MNSMEQLQSIDVRFVNPAELVDIREALAV